jgi:hypothetical protein
MKRYTLLVFWLTMIFFWFSIFFSTFSLYFTTSPINILILVHLSYFIFLFIIFGSLQSSVFLKFQPIFIVGCERILISALPIFSLPLIVSTLSVFNDISIIPFYTSLTQCFLLYFFYQKLPSSFKIKKYIHQEDGIQIIQKKFECIIFILLSLFLPILVYFTIYYNILITDEDSFSNLTTLFSIPLFYLSINSHKQFWFIKKSYQKIKLFILFFSILTIILWIQNNIIFKRYSHILKISKTYSYYLITFGVLLFLFSLVILFENKKLTRKLQIILISLVTLGKFYF